MCVYVQAWVCVCVCCCTYRYQCMCLCAQMINGYAHVLLVLHLWTVVIENCKIIILYKYIYFKLSTYFNTTLYWVYNVLLQCSIDFFYFLTCLVRIIVTLTQYRANNFGKISPSNNCQSLRTNSFNTHRKNRYFARQLDVWDK